MNFLRIAIIICSAILFNSCATMNEQRRISIERAITKKEVTKNEKGGYDVILGGGKYTKIKSPVTATEEFHKLIQKKSRKAPYDYSYKVEKIDYKKQHALKEALSETSMEDSTFYISPGSVAAIYGIYLTSAAMVDGLEAIEAKIPNYRVKGETGFQKKLSISGKNLAVKVPRLVDGGHGKISDSELTVLRTVFTTHDKKHC